MKDIDYIMCTLIVNTVTHIYTRLGQTLRASPGERKAFGCIPGKALAGKQWDLREKAEKAYEHCHWRLRISQIQIQRIATS